MMIETSANWYTRLNLARQLKESGNKEQAYLLLRSVSEEEDAFYFDKYRYGTYEDFIVEKTRFLIELALLELEVVGSAEGSMMYLDDALDLLDGMESVYPYIRIDEIETLRKTLWALDT